MAQQITVKSIKKPTSSTLKEDISWLSKSLGLATGRNTERIIEKILLQILEDTSKNISISTENLSEKLDLSVQRINYHVRFLINTGIIYREKCKLQIRGGSIKEAVNEMREDSNRIFDRVLTIAEEIDEGLGIKNRR